MQCVCVCALRSRHLWMPGKCMQGMHGVLSLAVGGVLHRVTHACAICCAASLTRAHGYPLRTIALFKQRCRPSKCCTLGGTQSPLLHGGPHLVYRVRDACGAICMLLRRHASSCAAACSLAEGVSSPVEGRARNKCVAGLMQRAWPRRIGCARKVLPAKVGTAAGRRSGADPWRWAGGVLQFFVLWQAAAHVFVKACFSGIHMNSNNTI